MIVRDRWKEPISKVVYVPTDKEPSLDSGKEEQAYWLLAKQIEDKLGPEGGAISEIYHQVTGPLGLTSSDTIILVRKAKKEGYLK